MFVIFLLNMNDGHLSEAASRMMRYSSVVLLVIMGLGDWLDGYLARKKGQITSLGSFLDPTADKLLMSCACILLATERAGVEGFILPSPVVVLIIGKDLFLLIGFIIVYFITEQIRIVPAVIGKTATGLQLTMVGAVLLAPEISQLFTEWIWCLRILWWSAALTAISATLIYIRRGSLYIEEYERNKYQKQ